MILPSCSRAALISFIRSRHIRCCPRIAFEGNPFPFFLIIRVRCLYLCTFASSPTASPYKMNTKITVKTFVNTTVRQQADDSSQRILQQVKKLTRELNVLQAELYTQLAEDDGTRQRRSVLAFPSATDDLRELKTAADQLRRIMWFYLDAHHQQTGSDAAFKQVESEGMAENRESLMQQHQPQPTPLEPGSFFERLNLVIDGYMQHSSIQGNRNRK